jgi:hypothetical protein
MTINNACNNTPNANLVQHAIPVVGSAGVLSSIGPLTNGQLAIGSTGANPVAATLTAGTGININNGSGSITISGAGVVNKIVRQVITSTGTYTPTSGMVYCDVELIGGGGGGGGVAAANQNCGSGGAAGGYTKKIFTAAQIGASQSVTIGTGGAGGVAGDNAGSTGGTSSFGAYLTATGGTGGDGGYAIGGSISIYGGFGGNGGVGSGGDVNTVGEYGHDAIWYYQSGVGQNGTGGDGGCVYFGGNGGEFGNLSGSIDATSYGGGGGGAVTSSPSISKAGGNGYAGICIITEYCSI